MVCSRTGRALAAALLCFAAPALLGSIGPRTNFDQRVLAAHNRERTASGIAKLKWDPSLAKGAKAWADELARSGRFAHSPDQPGAAPQGENLWAGTTNAYLPEDMVGLWIAEKQHFHRGTFPANSRTGRVEDVSHYTQLMWRQTGTVGCALGRGREEVLVCRYSQTGNVIGETPF